MSFIPNRYDLLHSDVDSYDIDQCKEIIKEIIINWLDINTEDIYYIILA